jgi:hypothetical protein
LEGDLVAGLQTSPAEVALDATPYARRTLLARFTTVRDLAPPRQIVDAVRRLSRA